MVLTKKKHEAKVFVNQVLIDCPEKGPTDWSESNIFLFFFESK